MSKQKQKRQNAMKHSQNNKNWAKRRQRKGTVTQQTKPQRDGDNECCDPKIGNGKGAENTKHTATAALVGAPTIAWATGGGGLAATPRPPRVGGVEGGVVWVGGSNLKPSSGPRDVMCFRPHAIKDKLKHHNDLKEGLDPDLRLEVDEAAKKKNMGIGTWAVSVGMLILMRGFDPVFRICVALASGLLLNEVCMIEQWGQITKEAVTEWVEHLGKHGDVCGKENLRLSGVALRSCLGPKMLTKVLRCTGPEASSPEVFRAAANQLSTMPSNVVRILSNQLGNLKLKDVPKENVSKLGEDVLERVDNIEASG